MEVKNNEDEQAFEFDQEQDLEYENGLKRQEKPVLFRLLAFLIFLAFVVFVFLTTWPGLTLPSLDFIGQSIKLSQDPAVKQLKQSVVRLDVISKTDKTAGEQKSGTGFNISPKGVIVTNRHVLSNAVNITVTFPGGKIYPAKKYKSSGSTDVAVIYLEAESLPFALVNTQKKVKVGDKVIIIGNPLRIGNVVMEGNVSAYLKVSGFPAPVFAIDAPVHPGNSGSPVFDENQQVVGIVFGSIHQTGSSEQQGVAIPVKEVAEFLH